MRRRSQQSFALWSVSSPSLRRWSSCNVAVASRAEQCGGGEGAGEDKVLANTSMQEHGQPRGRKGDWRAGEGGETRTYQMQCEGGRSRVVVGGGGGRGGNGAQCCSNDVARFIAKLL